MALWMPNATGSSRCESCHPPSPKWPHVAFNMKPPTSSNIVIVSKRRPSSAAGRSERPAGVRRRARAPRHGSAAANGSSAGSGSGAAGSVSAAAGLAGGLGSFLSLTSSERKIDLSQAAPSSAAPPIKSTTRSKGFETSFSVWALVSSSCSPAGGTSQAARRRRRARARAAAAAAGGSGRGRRRRAVLGLLHGLLVREVVVVLVEVLLRLVLALLLRAESRMVWVLVWDGAPSARAPSPRARRSLPGASH